MKSPQREQSNKAYYLSLQLPYVLLSDFDNECFFSHQIPNEIAAGQFQHIGMFGEFKAFRRECQNQSILCTETVYLVRELGIAERFYQMNKLLEIKQWI